jgi:hypothetical protein
MRWIAVCALAGSAMLIGCSKHDAASGSAPAAAPAQTPGAAALLGRPHPKAGLWRTTVNTNAGPGVSMTGELCLDASNEDAAFSSNGKGFNKDCEPVKYDTASGHFGFSTVCHMGNRTVTTSGVASGDFKTSYSVDLTTRMDPAPPGLPDQLHTTIQAKWEGPCPAGVKPGQVSMKLAGLGQG